ncbi:TraI domain-containing protein [Burkholderia arboris]|uniref:TraI domain-containing protein n=1 Tax=Burkholderia arboris TaxID=488730 RepID=UPI003CCC0413
MLLEHIRQRALLSSTQFTVPYRQPLERSAVLMQERPASERHHHAKHRAECWTTRPGDRRLRAQADPAAPAAGRHRTRRGSGGAGRIWTAATAYAALLHDPGKIAADFVVELAWRPWHDPPNHPYRFRYRDGRAIRLHCAATGLLSMQPPSSTGRIAQHQHECCQPLCEN